MDLSGNYIGLEGAKAMAPAIRDSSSLSSIVISKNNLGDEGKRAIARAIPSSTLQSLKCDALDLRADATSVNLSRKELGASDAELLAACMTKFMGSLSRLLIGKNRIGDEGCIALAEAMQQNESCKIEELDLHYNKIGVVGAKPLAAMIAVKGSLSLVNLLKNRFDVETATMLAAISKEKKLTLCGIAPDKTEANFRDQDLEPTDAILIAASIAFRGSLNSVALAPRTLIYGYPLPIKQLKGTDPMASIDLRGRRLGVWSPPS